MVCEECGREADDRANGWEARILELGDEDGEKEIAFYCAECAAREFHSSE